MDLKQLFESNSITIDLQGQGLIEIMDYEKFNEIVRYILIDFADTIEHGMIDNMSSQNIVEHFLS